MNLLKCIFNLKDERLFDCLGNMIIRDSDSRVTKIVKDAWNKVSEDEFIAMFSATKEVYKKRVIKYGDPYMNSPLAKLGKMLSGIN